MVDKTEIQYVGTEIVYFAIEGFSGKLDPKVNIFVPNSLVRRLKEEFGRKIRLVKEEDTQKEKKNKDK